ncbi:hypothetical protein ABVF11_07855 [Pediococcus argentinicus]|uniref:hypothetical protein n=1 Tax=Pediococcus argentinicus TaxID=480391 RepID=UPI00339063B0
MFKTQKLLSFLERVNLKSSSEQVLVDTAVKDLESGSYEESVSRSLQDGLEKLALNKQISQDGIELLSSLKRKEYSSNYGLASMTWFN